MEIRSKYSERVRVTMEQKGKSRTKQSHKDETNINKIVAKYKKTGILPALIKQNPAYGDFTAVPDYQESLNRVIFAQEQFNGLSAAVRKRFNNDPGEFLEFASNPENKETLYDLGLAERPKIENNEGGGTETPETPAVPAAGV